MYLYTYYIYIYVYIHIRTYTCTVYKFTSDGHEKLGEELCITFVTPSVTRCRHRTVHHVRCPARWGSN